MPDRICARCGRIWDPEGAGPVCPNCGSEFWEVYRHGEWTYKTDTEDEA